MLKNKLTLAIAALVFAASTAHADIQADMEEQHNIWVRQSARASKLHDSDSAAASDAQAKANEALASYKRMKKSIEADEIANGTLKLLPGVGGSTTAVRKVRRDGEVVSEILGTPTVRFNKDIDLTKPTITDRSATETLEENNTRCTYTLSGLFVASTIPEFHITSKHEWYLSPDRHESQGDDAWVELKSDDVKATLRIQGTSQDVVKCLKDHGFKPGKVDVRDEWQQVKAKETNAFS